MEQWLAPFLVFATGRGDLDELNPGAALNALLDHARRVELDRLAPERVTLASGRSFALDYRPDSAAPVLAVKVQELYGTRDTPRVLDGALPIVLELLSPANRPVQVTSDLAGFWAGSWREVRKDMAGRYPKHSWPDDPAGSSPGGR
jgi:ATP-dependent helicase HrpB